MFNISNYLEKQKQNPGAFVLVRLGDFYEILGEKARDAANVLNLTLMERNFKGKDGVDNWVPHVGFPFHVAEQYIEKLRQHGSVITSEPDDVPKELPATKPNHSERAHALLSASSSERWLNCPPSAVASEAYPNPDTEFTREGTLAHEVAEIYARREATEPYSKFLKALDSLEGVTGEMEECAQAYSDYIEEQTKSDRAVVLLEQKVDFSPWVPDGFGTCDCIIIQDDTLTIIDYKYGVGVPVSAKDNPQMKLYALGALNDYGFAYDVSKVEMHIFQPRINNISADSITVEELETWATKVVKPTAEKAAKGKGNYKPGGHCKFCPHAGRCRALTKTCTEYVETHSLRVAVPVLAPHEVAEVLQMEPLISLWLKRVKDQAMTTMLNGDNVPGWKIVEGKQGNRKWKDELEVAKALEAAGYSQADITETKLLSPAAMDKALGKKTVAELLADHIDRAQGAPVLAPETDKRPTYDRLAEAKKDFE